MPIPLSKRQRDVLAYIETFIAERGYAPTLHEIGAGCGMRAVSTVHKHLTALTVKGYVRRQWNGHRSTEIVPPPECCPTCGRAMVA